MSQIVVSSKPPLFFQHDGHSRTIVGMERRRASASASESVFLLVLDPGVPTGGLVRALQAKGSEWQRMVKRGLDTLRMREVRAPPSSMNARVASSRYVFPSDAPNLSIS